MAQRIEVFLEDDLDGSEASHTIHFGFEQTDYVIDLNDSNAEELRSVLKKYAGAARKTTKAPAAKAVRAAPSDGPSTGAVRAWAESNGLEVNPRGRIKRDLIEQYLAAHSN